MWSVLVYVFAITLLRWVRRRRTPKRSGLCQECYFAHIQHGINAKTATYCTFGGGVRTVPINVLYCTDYRGRNAVPRVVRIGFAQEDAGGAAS